MYYLSEEIWFPPPGYAGKDGLLAIGGDLSLDRLLLAYRSGIFPLVQWGRPHYLVESWSEDGFVSEQAKSIQESAQGDW